MPTPKTNGSPKSSSTPKKRPSLEFFPRPGEAPQRIVLDPLPFTIGRVETADLPIDSTRVSREHAQIELENGRYIVRDLESTNGTYVNGKQIDSAPLVDGDTVLVADFELTFVAAAGDRIRRMATQLMTGVQAPPASTPAFGDEVDDLRRMHEVLLQGLVFPELQKIVTLPDKDVFSVYAPSPEPAATTETTPLESLSYTHPSHPSVRYFELHRALAQQIASEAGGHDRLMVDIATWEIEVNPGLPRHLARLADLWPSEDALTVSIAADAVADLREVARFCEELHNLGISICYRDFVGSGSQVLQFSDLPPDFLMLSPAMTRAGLRGDHQHQKLQSVVSACGDIRCRPILVGDNGRQVREIVDELECDLAWIRAVDDDAPEKSDDKKEDARELAFAF